MTYTPTAIGFFITSLAAPRLIPLLGRQVLTVGYIVGAFGLCGDGDDRVLPPAPICTASNWRRRCSSPAWAMGSA